MAVDAGVSLLLLLLMHVRPIVPERCWRIPSVLAVGKQSRMQAIEIVHLQPQGCWRPARQPQKKEEKTAHAPFQSISCRGKERHRYCLGPSTVALWRASRSPRARAACLSRYVHIVARTGGWLASLHMMRMNVRIFVSSFYALTDCARRGSRCSRGALALSLDVPRQPSQGGGRHASDQGDSRRMWGLCCCRVP